SGGRSLDYTITEFPFFSALLGDLHPHVMALPFGLLALALAFDAFHWDGVWWQAHRWRILASALILGSLFFLNTWDFPTYAAIFIAALGLGMVRYAGGVSREVWKRLIAIGASVLVLAVVLFMPFYVTFRSQASGLLPVSTVYSQPLHLFIFWGPFILLLLGFLLVAWREGFSGSLWGRGPKLLVVLLTLGPFILWALVALVLNARGSEQGTAPANVARKLLFLVPWLVLVPVALVGLMRRLKEGSAGYALLLLLAALLLTMAVELFFIRDTFGTRMNTVFKFYYQAWLLLSVSCAFGLAWLVERWPVRAAARSGAGLWLLVSIGLIAVALIYPVASLTTETRSFQGRGTLDGLSFVAASSPHEYEAQRWLQTQVRGTPVIVEAVGGQYSPYARVSARTGLPTVIGWPGHESQWRGSDRLFRGRPEDVDAIYKSEDSSLVRKLLAKYNVSYVYVGDLERAKYGAQVLDKFSSNFPVAFANQGVAIYAVKDGLARAQKVAGR
ncbi:MAG: hypothetical protein HY677_00955, partial [Chloroflexi bacterium]|nr:hypothetical protein [Chloroflexota bacterium]